MKEEKKERRRRRRRKKKKLTANEKHPNEPLVIRWNYPRLSYNLFNKILR